MTSSSKPTPPHGSRNPKFAAHLSVGASTRPERGDPADCDRSEHSSPSPERDRLLRALSSPRFRAPFRLVANGSDWRVWAYEFILGELARSDRYSRPKLQNVRVASGPSTAP